MSTSRRKPLIGIISFIIAITGFLFLLLGLLTWLEVIPPDKLPELVFLVILIGHYNYGLLSIILGFVFAVASLLSEKITIYAIIGLIISFVNIFMIIYISFFTPLKRLIGQ